MSNSNAKRNDSKPLPKIDMSMQQFTQQFIPDKITLQVNPSITATQLILSYTLDGKRIQIGKHVSNFHINDLRSAAEKFTNEVLTHVTAKILSSLEFQQETGYYAEAYIESFGPNSVDMSAKDYAQD